MLKASALYLVIIVATIIAIFSAALISTAYFYRLEYQKNLRFHKLAANLASGIAIALSSENAGAGQISVIDLYSENTDSVSVTQENWGLFDLAVVKSFTQRDTLKKAFLIARKDDDLAALYLSDEDRPLSVSGSTEITGDAVLPKAGIKQAYVEGRPYSGSKLVYGSIKTSERFLPKPDESRLRILEKYLADTAFKKAQTPETTSNSFYRPSIKIRYAKAVTLSSMAGKLVVISDTLITITKDAVIKDLIIVAPAIVVEEGFKGSCQLFASDSVVVGKNAVFNYPSAIAVLKSEGSKIQSKIQLGAGTQFSGILFSYEKKRSDLQTIISLGKNSHVKGEVYATGYIKMEKPISVYGKVSCNRFIIQTPTTLYENYLLDIAVNRNKRSPYYLSSFLFNSLKEDKQILKWLE